MYPIICYNEDAVIPDSGTFFVVAANGFYLHKDTGVLSGFVKVESIGLLNEFNCGSEIKFHLRKIPGCIVANVRKIFAEVFDRYRSECCVLLYYSKAYDQYTIVVPQQYVGYACVHYDRPSISNLLNSTPVGTIHSHSDFDAYHSGQDHHDESSFDGVHITFGNNDESSISISASLVMNGERMTVDPLDIMEGIIPSGTGLYNTTECSSFLSDDMDAIMNMIQVGQGEFSKSPLMFHEFVKENSPGGQG